MARKKNESSEEKNAEEEKVSKPTKVNSRDESEKVNLVMGRKNLSYLHRRMARQGQFVTGMQI